MQAVIGARGMIGGAILRTLQAAGIPAIGTSREGEPGFPPLDLADSTALAGFLDSHRPEAIYLAAAESNVDGVEGNPGRATIINIDAPRLVLEMAPRWSARVVLFSSDYVFDGRAGPYTEEAPTCPINEYGRQKAALEEMARGRADVLVLRVTHVFGRAGTRPNFATRCLQALRGGLPFAVPCDQWSTPTHADTIAQAALDLVSRGASGILHVAAQDTVPRDEWARRLARAFQADEGLVVPVTTDSLGQKAPRPRRAGLRAARAEAILGRRFGTLDEAIDRFRIDTMGERSPG